ncbi:MAG: trimethylamine methyltransferase family protein [Desulfomonilaceae bacterium]|nr:trimethylamine methyltransferase family protein [Desulfomonilaceae bacterium]
MGTGKGLPGGQYRPLNDEDVKAIHQTSLRVFEEVGFQVGLKGARDLFKKAGAEVDDSNETVKLSPDLVMELIGRAPSTVMLCGRAADGQFDCEVGGTRVYMGTGGTALNVQDPGSNDRRPSRLSDVADMARVVDALDNIHFYMLNVYPNDVPARQVDVNRFGAALNRTRKHVMGGVYTVDGVRNVARMAGIIAGSPEAFRERPFLSMVTCVISPFKVDKHYGRLAVEAAQAGIPLVVPSEPLCGATAPITLAANLVVWTVDTLAGVMLAQLVRPGTPVLAGCVSSITDLRDLKYLSGAVEMGLLNAGASQLAEFYDLPVYVTAGMSDSKVNDAQAGYESAITNVMVALAGGNWIHDAAGFLEFCMTASYDKLVIDNEILGMTMRAVAGIEVNEQTLAYELIKQAGPGGHFVSSRHTRRHMRTELYRPQFSDRENRDQWNEAGRKDARTRATETVRGILDEPAEPMLSAEVRARIRESIPGIEDFILQ